MDIQVRKYRSMLKAVGKEISDLHERVDADTLLEIAQSLEQSKLGTAWFTLILMPPYKC